MQYDCEQACPRAGPGQVCAQPRTDPTRSGDQNFNLPSTGVVDQIRSDGLEFHRCRVDRSGLISGNGENPAKKRWKIASIQQEKFEKWLKSGQISPDPARSRSFSARSQLGLPKKIPTVGSTLSHQKNRWVNQIGFLGFERRRFDIWPANLSFWRMKSVADRRSNRFGRWQVGLGSVGNGWVESRGSLDSRNCEFVTKPCKKSTTRSYTISSTFHHSWSTTS